MYIIFLKASGFTLLTVIAGYLFISIAKNYRVSAPPETQSISSKDEIALQSSSSESLGIAAEETLSPDEQAKEAEKSARVDIPTISSLPRLTPQIVIPPLAEIIKGEKNFPDVSILQSDTVSDPDVPEEITKEKPSAPPPAPPPTPPPMPPLDESAILAAVVKIQCPNEDMTGKYVGSGFSVSGNKVITAAHVIKDAGSVECDVIFPDKRKPAHFLKGAIDDLDAIKKRHDEDGIDIAVILLRPIKEYPEARAIFSAYPAVSYPFCADPKMLQTVDPKKKNEQGDTLIHFGYPSNFVNQDYLSSQEGRAVSYADITGIEDQFSDDFSQKYKTPVFSYTGDETRLHPYMVSRVASFYGDSGGLAFNKTKQCILGPHRGGTVGRAAGENYSIFPLIRWWQENVTR